MMFSLVTGLPSTTSVTDVSIHVVRRLRRYYAAVRLLARVHARITLLASRAGPTPVGPERWRGLSVLARAVSWLAYGSPTTPDPEKLALALPSILPARCDHTVGIRYSFFEAQFLARQCLCLRFTWHLTMPGARLEVKMVRYSFLVGLFHPLLHAGLSRRFRSLTLPAQFQHLGPNVAFVLAIFGLLAIYWEFLRPGRIYPGILGAASLVLGVWFLGLMWLAAAAVLFLVESCWNTRYLAGLGGTAALILGAYRHHVALYLAIPLGLTFGGITIWLAAAAKRARRNKRVDL